MPTRASKEAKTGRNSRQFHGWQDAAVEFLRGIEDDNSKSFWTANKEIYQTEVLAPMVALLADLEAEFGAGRVFRPYRDTRFSADKSPYKTSIAAHNEAAYISLSPDALGVGAGLYMPSPDQLLRYRAAVAGEKTGPEVEKIVKALAKSGIDVGGHGELKTAPRGYSGDHPRIHLLRQKGLTASKEWPVGPWLATSAARERISKFIGAVEPFKRWIEQNVGAPQDGQ